MNKDAALNIALKFIERVNKDGWMLADFEPEMYAALASIKEALAKDWVGLTDEEVNKYFENEWLTYDNYYDVFKVILEWQEEKLRIKNG